MYLELGKYYLTRDGRKVEITEILEKRFPTPTKVRIRVVDSGLVATLYATGRAKNWGQDWLDIIDEWSNPEDGEVLKPVAKFRIQQLNYKYLSCWLLFSNGPRFLRPSGRLSKTGFDQKMLEGNLWLASDSKKLEDAVRDYENRHPGLYDNVVAINFTIL